MPVSPSVHRGRRPDPASMPSGGNASYASAVPACPPPPSAPRGRPTPAFYAWRRRLHASPVRQAIRNAEPPADAHFVPVRLLAPTPVEVHLPGGASLRLAPGCDLDFVRSLVAALGGPSVLTLPGRQIVVLPRRGRYEAGIRRAVRPRPEPPESGPIRWSPLHLPQSTADRLKVLYWGGHGLCLWCQKQEADYTHSRPFTESHRIAHNLTLRPASAGTNG